LIKSKTAIVSFLYKTTISIIIIIIIIIMPGDGINENIVQLFFDKRYHSMLSTLINAIQNSNYGDKDIMASPAVADLVEKILSESKRWEVTTVHAVWTLILWMFGNFVQKNLYGVRYGALLHRLSCNGTLKNITRIVSALLVSKIMYSLPLLFNGPDAQEGGGVGAGGEDHEVNDTTKIFANYFVTGFSSIVFEIVIRRIQISAIVSTILLLAAIFAGIVVLNSDNTASLLLDMGYENEKDGISIFTICGFCLLLAGWHCCAGITKRILDYKKVFLSSFPYFLLVIAILTLPSLRNLIIEILGPIWRYFGEILTLLSL
jgi:hypothetical protein